MSKRNNSEKIEFAVTGPRKRRRWVFANRQSLKKIREFAHIYAQARKFRPNSQRAVEFFDLPLATPAPSASEDYMQLVRAILGWNDDARILAMRGEAKAAGKRKRVLHTLMYHQPDWHPHISTKGDPFAGLSSKEFAHRPVIYWSDNTVFAELIGRAALHQAGVSACHFSDWVHAHGEHWLTRRLLQKPIFELEQRYMLERFVSFPHTHFGAMRGFAESMRANANMFTMNNAFLGRRHACTPVTATHSLIQSSAPLNMVRRYNAVLVPLTALETEPLEAFQVQFHAPITADYSLDRDEDIARMAQVSARRQMASLRACPEQWLAWAFGQFDKPHAGHLHRPGM